MNTPKWLSDGSGWAPVRDVEWDGPKPVIGHKESQAGPQEVTLLNHSLDRLVKGVDSFFQLRFVEIVKIKLAHIGHSTKVRHTLAVLLATRPRD